MRKLLHNAIPTTLPTFQLINDAHIKSVMGKTHSAYYKSNIIWTPQFYKATILSHQFLSRVRQYASISNWNRPTLLSFVELFVIEATRDTVFQYTLNYKATPMKKFPFHGNVDILIYNSLKDAQYTPMIPILLPTIKKDLFFDTDFEQMSIPGMYSCCHWFLKMAKLNNTPMQYIRGMQTNGRLWMMSDITDGGMRKSHTLPVNKIHYGDSRYDYSEDDLKAVVGLLRFGMQISENIV